jgi:hypothetical protein
MDKNQAAHDIALIAAEKYIESNMPAYNAKGGFKALVSDLVSKYKTAYDQALEELQ